MHGESHPYSGACSTLRATLDRTQHGTKYSSDIRNLGLRAEQFLVEFIRHFGWARHRAVRGSLAHTIGPRNIYAIPIFFAFNPGEGAIEDITQRY